MYDIVLDVDAVRDLDACRAFHRVLLLEAIRRHLQERAEVMEGRKKKLTRDDGTSVFQLRVGEFRVFYDVEQDTNCVRVRYIRRKGRKTTGEIL